MKISIENRIIKILQDWIIDESIDEIECESLLFALLEQEFDNSEKLINYLIENVNCQDITFNKMKLIISQTIESWEEEILTDVEHLYDDAPEPSYLLN